MGFCRVGVCCGDIHSVGGCRIGICCVEDNSVEGCHVEGYRASVNSVKAIVSGDVVLGAIVRGGSE